MHAFHIKFHSVKNTCAKSYESNESFQRLNSLLPLVENVIVSRLRVISFKRKHRQVLTLKISRAFYSDIDCLINWYYIEKRWFQ